MNTKRAIYAHSTLLFFMFSVLTAHYREESVLFKGTYTENYINRWAIQAIADHVFDPRTGHWFLWPTKDGGVTFDPEAVKPGDIVFARDLDAYFKKLHPRIKHPYILVTAGEQRDAVTEKSMSRLDDATIIAWFSVHASAITHPKFQMLPLGIYQDKKFYEPRAELTKQFAQWRKAPKEGLLYSNYGDIKGGKPERAEVDSIFDDAVFCYKAKRLPFLEYMEDMSHYKFTLSPPGYGPDCYRHWEAMLMGSIPIIRSSHMDPLYADLPVVIIKDWHEVTEEFLEKKYQEMTAKKFNIEKLFMEYWWRKIRDVQAAFLEGYKK